MILRQGFLDEKQRSGDKVRIHGCCHYQRTLLWEPEQSCKSLASRHCTRTGSSPAYPCILKMMEPQSYGVSPLGLLWYRSYNIKLYIYSQHAKCLLLAYLCLQCSFQKKLFCFWMHWGNPGHKHHSKTRNIYFNSQLNIFSLVRHCGICF